MVAFLPQLQCHYGNYTFFSCSKSQQKPLMVLEAGESAALAYLPEFFKFVTTNFFATVFIGTTGGVMPLGVYPYAVWFAGDAYKLKRNLPSPIIADWMNYTVSYQQRGLTATVTCITQTSSPIDHTITPSLPGLSSNLSIITPMITCGNATAVPLAQRLVGADFMLASSCSLPNQTQYVCFLKLALLSALMRSGFIYTDIFAGLWCVRQPCGWQPFDYQYDLPTRPPVHEQYCRLLRI